MTLKKKHSIIFTPEHREFLKVLHTIDRREKVEYTETFEEDAEIEINERPFFYNWLADDVEIKEKMDWPYLTILEDVFGMNKVWLKSWGEKPNSEQEIESVFANWINKAPILIPLRSHRFVVSDLNLDIKPVLSVWGSDIIVYGWSLRSYLLKELQDHLNIKEMVYDKDDKCYYSELIQEVQSIFKRDYTYDEDRHIPYWEEMILIWTSGWSSFGLKYPYDNNSTIQPIVKTYSPGNTGSDQKKFNTF